MFSFNDFRDFGPTVAITNIPQAPFPFYFLLFFLFIEFLKPTYCLKELLDSLAVGPMQNIMI